MDKTPTYTYANRVDIDSSVYDILISFYQVSPIKNENGEVIAENKGINTNIVMSPQHAKVFVKIMQDQIAWYEKQFGEIKLPSRDQSTDKGQ